MKRLLDIILSITMLIVFLPILVIIAIIIMLTMGHPIVFTQKRSGLNDVSFKLYKFRTMSNNRDKNIDVLSDIKRLTKVGAFLRRTSLDELPSLWNVLIGDMSLVGPRPLLIEYIDYYTKEEAKRNQLKPGITGWAQINGRNKISWKKKFELDTWYIENQSILLDIKILFVTLWKVLKWEGISHSADQTMPFFLGSDKEREQ